MFGESFSEVLMSAAQSHQPTVLSIKVNPDRRFSRLTPQDSIFTFTTFPMSLGHWSVFNIDISSVGLPSDPVHVFTQMKFPANTNIGVSDNFSTLVASATRTNIQVSIWRVDSSDPAGIQYELHGLVIV
jgi:hypothetical protein